MIFSCVRLPVKPEDADQWPELTRAFTEGARAEPGNLFSDWSRNVEDPNEHIVIEGFADDAAEAHVGSDHFTTAQAELPQYLARTPKVRNMLIEGEHWDDLGEFTVS